MFWLGVLSGIYGLLIVEFIGALIYAVKRGKKK
jgi:hypothetical protein